MSLRGVGLGATTHLTVVGLDSQWQVPLEVTGTNDTSLTAAAATALPLEDAALELTSSSGTGSAASLLATACGATAPLDSLFNYVLFADPVAGYSTKDFAFYQNITKATHKRLYHLFYIRHKDSDAAEPGLGHAWSSDLRTWRVDLGGLLPKLASTFNWDRFNVWAPHIVEHGDSTFLFYCGVGPNFDQSIGYAATTDLDTCNTQWNRYDTPVLTADTTTWAARRRFSSTAGRQLRDPFVFAHPDSAGVFYLLFSAGDTNTAVNSTATLVGLARNRTIGSMQRWVDLGIYRNTGVDSTGFAFLEGPMLMHDRASSTRWWMLFSNNDGNCLNNPAPSSVRYQRLDLGRAPSDTTPEHWKNPRATPALFAHLAPDSTVWGWNGTEYLKDVDDREFMAGFTAWGQPRGGVCGVGTQGIAISQMHWRAPADTDFVLRRPGAAAAVTAVDEDGSAHPTVKMRMVEFRPRSGRISWRIELPTSLRVRMDIFDVMGRVSSTLVNGVLGPGTTTLTWDTADLAGTPVRSGMYYAKLSFDGGIRLATIPLVR
ncbi:MAG: family 43 glycosylhydrolase [Candidatus Eisenbacteria bacterium]